MLCGKLMTLLTELDSMRGSDLGRISDPKHSIKRTSNETQNALCAPYRVGP